MVKVIFCDIKQVRIFIFSIETDESGENIAEIHRGIVACISPHLKKRTSPEMVIDPKNATQTTLQPATLFFS